MLTIYQPFNIEYLNDVLHKNQGYSKPFSYDGNEDENYTLFANGQEVCQIACGEDLMLDFIILMNNKVSKTGNDLFLTENDLKPLIENYV